ncbi:MAG: DHH family phosphoesterase [Lachnospiraceae bacterium]|nr:DHH family phosphoesterase [Lachnospiraceae bacterium]
MKYPKQIKGGMRFIPYWPLFLLPVVFLLVAVVYLSAESARIAVLVFLCVFAAFSLVWMVIWRSRLMHELAGLFRLFDSAQDEQFRRFPIPYALIDSEGAYFWKNEAYKELPSSENEAGTLVGSYPQLAGLLGAEGDVETDLELDGRLYRVQLIRLEDKEHLSSVIFLDETELSQARQTIREQRPVIAQISVDNYDEAIASTETVRRPLLSALIERRITKYFLTNGGIVNKQDKDKFTVFMNAKCLDRVREDRFSVLEDVKSINIGNEVGATISIGVGELGEDLDANSQFAVTALDLCLGRGGDQAIIKGPEGFTFFGGKVEHNDKSTKVKARTMAHALRKIINTKERVLVMGHKIPDADALGAAAGFYRIGKALGKEVRIVTESDTSSIAYMLEKLREEPDYGDDAFVSCEQALELLSPSTMVVLVDLNSSPRSECPELLERSRSTVIVDHHRQGGATLQGAVLSYIEPYASSASELVTELIQYISDDLRPTPTEADALYAGIIVDTDSFLTKTGVRTFEAAAYLRRCGADMARVRKLFRDGMDDFKAKADTVSSVEIFEESFAIGRCMAEDVENPTVVGAQAANELLDVRGIKASFVFTPYDGQIYISARSIDEVNVQLVMERLGGGGHLSVAGAQLVCTLEEAISLTKETIKQMLEEGAI